MSNLDFTNIQQAIVEEVSPALTEQDLKDLAVNMMTEIDDPVTQTHGVTNEVGTEYHPYPNLVEDQADHAAIPSNADEIASNDTVVDHANIAAQIDANAGEVNELVDEVLAAVVEAEMQHAEGEGVKAAFDAVISEMLAESTVDQVPENSVVASEKTHEKQPVVSENTESDTNAHESVEQLKIEESVVVVGFKRALSEIEAQLGVTASENEIRAFRMFYLAGVRHSTVFSHLAMNQVIATATGIQQGLQAAIDTVNNGNSWLLTHPLNTGIDEPSEPTNAE